MYKVHLESYELSIVLSVKKAKISRHMHTYIFIYIFYTWNRNPKLSKVVPSVFSGVFMIAPRSSVRHMRKKSLQGKKQNYLETNSEPIGSMYGLFTYI